MVRVFVDRELWTSVANDVPPSPGSPYHAVLRGQVRHDLTGLWTNYTNMTFRSIRASYTSVGAVETCFIVACMRYGDVRRLYAMFVIMTSER